MIYIYTKLATNVLQKLHAQMWRFHNLIFALKIADEEEFLISIGTLRHSWHSTKRYYIDSKTRWRLISRFKQTNIANIAVLLSTFANSKNGILTIAPQGKLEGLGQGHWPQGKFPPVRVRVWLRVSFGILGQLSSGGNCPRTK